MKAYGLMEDYFKSFLTSRQDEGEWSDPFLLCPGDRNFMNSESEFGWPPQPVWTFWSRKKLPLPGNESSITSKPSNGLIATPAQLSSLLFIHL
jgi:hypothetical protein